MERGVTLLPLMLLPGMMCDARLFQAQIDGFGTTREIVSPALTQGDSVESIAAVLLREAPPVFNLGGLSMGGIVAMEMLRQAPDRIARLALLDTNPLVERPEIAALRKPQITKVRDGQLISVMRDEMKPNYLAPGPRRAGILDLVVDMARDLGSEVFIRQSRALQTRPDQQDTLRRFKGPALVLCGESDTLCPVSRHELMAAAIPDAELVVVPKAGHLPVLEQPEVVNTALERWLSRPVYSE